MQASAHRNVEQNWAAFKNAIQTTVEKNIPSRMTSCRYNLPWITPAIRRLCRKKQRYYKIAKRTKKEKHWQRFKECKIETRNALRKAHNDYVNNILNEGLAKNDNKKFWKYIKARKQDSMGISPLKHQGSLHTDNKTKAELLSNQFKSVFTPQTVNESAQMEGTPYPNIPPLHITQPGVQKLMESLKTNKASGPDNLPALILKELAPQLSQCLTEIFRQSLTSGKLPKDWKDAHIAPIFKKGNRHLAENYRPVSLTSICAKMMEHILCHHIRSHFDHHQILNQCQHGFRARHSCESQLITTMQDLLQNVEQKRQVDLLVLDLAKAFDKVPHRQVLQKVEHYGIRGNILAWLSDFLMDRTQSVVVDGEFSAPVPVTSGVPQGTVLGPVLFLAHINDLPSCVKSPTRLFADDCILYRPILSEDDHTILQQDLDNLANWASRWGMKFNATKCETMRVGTIKSNRIYSLDNHPLREVEHTKYLGVTISNDLSWSRHINNISAKGNSKLGFLWRNLSHCHSNIKKQAYVSLV